MAAGRVPDLIDALVRGIRVTDGFRAPYGGDEGVTVYDGPEVLMANGPDPDGLLVIGYGGEDLVERDSAEQGDTSTTGAAEFKVLAGYRRQDQTDGIDCVAWVRLGDVDTAAARRAAWAIVDAVDQWVTDHPTFGLAEVIDVQSAARSMTQYLHPDGGSVAQVTFVLNARTRTSRS